MTIRAEQERGPISAAKRRRVAVEEPPAAGESQRTMEGSDTIDPVERLLSLPNHDSDILLSLDDDVNYSQSNIEASAASLGGSPKGGSQISLNFTKILNESLKSYYSNFGKCHLEIYNDHSSFSLLNRAQSSPQELPEESTNITQQAPASSDIPFFKNVNFNAKPQKAYTFDEYLSYDELTADEGSEDENSSNTDASSSPSSASPSDPKTPQSTSPLLAQSKMSFHYRRDDKLNLSLNAVDNEDQHDVFKFLNKRSIMTGRASEMVSTGNFLINDFFL